MLVLVASAPAWGSTFQGASAYGTGTSPKALVFGDFDGDGKQDLAVANSGSNDVSILLGKGDGTLNPARAYTAGANPSSIASGDFNRDGVLDLVTANYDSQDASVLLGVGDGTFRLALRFDIGGPGPSFVAVGDFNADGVEDVVVGGVSYASVLIGNGNGSFRAPLKYPLPGLNTACVVVADFNRDGRSDFAAANRFTSSPDGSDSVSILLGNGDGTFLSAVHYRVGANPLALGVGDFNSDGKKDLAVAIASTNEVSLLIGNGDGSFNAPVRFQTGSGPFSVVVGDFDGDGREDVVSANRDSDNISLLIGGGDGVLQPAAGYGTGGAHPSFVAVGDLNGDGRLDLATTNTDSNTVGILLSSTGTAVCTMRAAASYEVGGQPASAAVGDVDGDGKTDLVVANSDQPRSISVLLGRGDGTFRAITAAPGICPWSVTLADLNRDARLDLAASSACGGASVWLGNGDGTFQGSSEYASPGSFGISRNIAVGDFNRDGNVDLVVTNESTSNISISLGRGDGSFQTVNYFVGGYPSGLAVGDLNRDGKDDLAVAGRVVFTGGPGHLSVLLGNGDGTFQVPRKYDVGQNPGSVVIADLNSDGRKDLAIANSSGTTILLGLGDGTLQQAAPQSASSAVAVGEFNQDGKRDLVVAYPLAILVGNGDGTFRSATQVGSSHTSVVVADLDRNGTEDLVAVKWESNTVSVLLNSCLSVEARAMPYTGNGQSAVAGMAVGTPPAVIVRDANNNPVPGVPVTFAAAAGGGSVTVASAATNSAGIAAVGSWTLGTTPGPNTLTATVTGLAGGPVTFAATGTSPVTITSFTVDPTNAAAVGVARLSWATSGAQSLTIGGSGGTLVTISGTSGTMATNGTTSTTFNTTTTFTLTATSSTGRTAIASATVTLFPEPGQGLGMPAITTPASSARVTVSGVTFQWNPVTNAAGYDLRIYNGYTGRTEFSGSLVGISSTRALVGLPAGLHLFAVRACTGATYSDAGCGSFSTRDFTVAPSTPSDAPRITAPTEAASLRISTQTLSWTAVSKADTSQQMFYEVLIEDTAGGTTAAQIRVLDPSTSTVATLRTSYNYRMRVRACQAGCGPYSNPVTFAMVLTPTPATAPTITSATMAGNTLSAAWTPVAGADLYQFQVIQSGTGPGGGALTVAAQQVSATTLSVPVPTGAANLIVQACTGDACGPASTPAAVNATGANPTQPNIGTRLRGTIVSGPIVSFSWNRIPTDNGSNTTYRLFVQDQSRQAAALDVYTTNNFYSAYFTAEGVFYDSLVIANPGCTAVSTTCSAAESAGPASGFNVAGTSAVSPTLNSPAHQSTVRQGNLMFAWTPVVGATLYHYYISGGGPNPAATGVTTGLFAQVPLSAVNNQPTTYTGIARACTAGATCSAGSDAGWGPWSVDAGPGVTSFTVIP